MQVIQWKSGHRDACSALTYDNIHFLLGEKLQEDMFGEKVPYVFTGVGVNRYSKNLNNVGKKQVKHICFDNTPNNTYEHRQKYDELNIGFTSVGGHI